MFSSNAARQAAGDPPSASPQAIDWRRRIGATLAVLIILQLPLGRLLPGTGFSRQLGEEGLFWLLTLLLVAYVTLVEHRPLSSIGLGRTTWKSAAFGIGAACVMIGGFAVIYLVVFPALGLSATETALRAVKSTPVWFQLLLVTRAAVFEEIYYRGFAIERLTEITGRRWAAALISLLAFTFAHLDYWGWPHLIVAAFGGIVLTGLYLFRRDLSANMIAHFVTDGVGFLLA
jgi:membrane protease YdiL (CAAX protease family)